MRNSFIAQPVFPLLCVKMFGENGSVEGNANARMQRGTFTVSIVSGETCCKIGQQEVVISTTIFATARLQRDKDRPLGRTSRATGNNITNNEQISKQNNERFDQKI